MYPNLSYEEFVAAALRVARLRRSQERALGSSGPRPSARIFWRGAAVLGAALERVGNGVEGLGTKLQRVAKRADLSAAGVGSVALSTEMRR